VGLFSGTQWESPSQCRVCNKAAEQCSCPSALNHFEQTNTPARGPRGQLVKVRVEKRKAKRVVTVISGLKSNETNLTELLSRLKGACGAGGGIETDNLVIQGDQVKRVVTVLSELGYRVAS